MVCLSCWRAIQRHVGVLAASCLNRFNFHVDSNYCHLSGHLFIAIKTSQFFNRLTQQGQIITNQQALELSLRNFPRQKGYYLVYRQLHSSQSATSYCMHQRSHFQSLHDLTCQTVESIERTDQSWGSEAHFQAHSDQFETVGEQMSPSYQSNFGHDSSVNI